MSRHLFQWKGGHRKTIIPVTEEREFEKNAKRLEILDENSRKLYKNVKAYIESNTAVSKASHKTTQDLISSGLCQYDDDLRTDVEMWDAANARIEAQCTELNGTCQKAVVEPVKKLNSVFPSVQAAVKKREQSLQEVVKCQQKFDKYQERDRTGANIVKADASKKSLNAAYEEFQQHNTSLSEDMPELYTDRIAYIEPCLEALIKAQVMHESEGFKVLSELPTLTESTDDYSNSIQAKLAHVRALSITVDD